MWNATDEWRRPKMRPGGAQARTEQHQAPSLTPPAKAMFSVTGTRGKGVFKQARDPLRASLICFAVVYLPRCGLTSFPEILRFLALAPKQLDAEQMLRL